MNKLKNVLLVWTVVFAVGLQSSAVGAIGLNSLDFNWGALGNDFVIDNKEFR